MAKSTKTTTRSACAVSRDEFAAKAQPIHVRIGDFPSYAEPKTFSTGSMGWNVNTKIPVIIDGKAVMCQVGLNITVIGSKDAE